jgi:hypothetical protein
MFFFKINRIPFSVLLLTAFLSVFCAGSVAEMTEREALGSEVEEVILGRSQEEKSTNMSVHFALLAAIHKNHRLSLHSGSLHSSENSLRNGLGAPLTL